MYPNYKWYRKLIMEVKDQMREKINKISDFKAWGIFTLVKIYFFYKVSQIDA